MEYNRPKVGLAVCIVKDGKVLMCQRKKSYNEHLWSFPGGHLELFETWEDCAKRESFEETGIQIKNVKFITCTNDICVEDNTHYITINMLADYDMGEVQLKESEEHECWEWFNWDNLPKDLFFNTENFLKTGFRPY